MSLSIYMFFIFAFLGGAALNGIMEGSAIPTTTLTAALAISDSTASVRSTQAFKTSNGIIYIDAEAIQYTGLTGTTFTGLSRAQRDSTAGEHRVNARVYSDAPGVVNVLVGFNIAEAFSDDSLFGVAKGIFKTARQSPQFLQAIIRMIAWDYGFLSGPYVWVKNLLLYPLTGTIVLGFIRMALGR